MCKTIGTKNLPKQLKTKQNEKSQTRNCGTNYIPRQIKHIRQITLENRKRETAKQEQNVEKVVHKKFMWEKKEDHIKTMKQHYAG